MSGGDIVATLLRVCFFNKVSGFKRPPFSMQVKTYLPHPALQQLVLGISTIDFTLPEGMGDVVTPYPPSPFQSLMFYINNPVSAASSSTGVFSKQSLCLLTGPQYSRVNIRVHQHLTSVRVDFAPGSMFRLLGLPMNRLFDGGFDAVDFFGAEMSALNECLQNTTDLEQGKNRVEQFLINQLARTKAILPFDAAMLLLLKNHGNLSVEKTASHACLSLKQFERKCAERIGMNPKTYTRILKFSKAYRLHETFPHRNWTSIAHQAGYYDQMHMIRDFKVFAGVNPSVIKKELLLTPIRMQKNMTY